MELILRSVLIFGRELRFPLDIALSALPSLVYNNTESIISYLHLTDFNCFFTSEIVKILVEDRRTVHVERINSTRQIVTMYPEDLFMDRTAIKSDKARNKVANLSYATRGSFQTDRGTWRGSYNKPDSHEFKFMSGDLYILPPPLKNYEPIYNSDNRYLIHYHTTIFNLLKQTYQLYNKQ